MYVSIHFPAVKKNLDIIDNEKEHIDKAWRALKQADLSQCDEFTKRHIQETTERLEQLRGSIFAKRDALEEILNLFEESVRFNEERLNNVSRLLAEIRED